MLSVDQPLTDLTSFVDVVRIEAATRLDRTHRSQLGQFFTPMGIARLMASLSQVRGDTLRLLDAGAGVGVLSAAWTAAMCNRDNLPSAIDIVAYEIDPALLPPLQDVLDACQHFAASRGVTLTYEIREEDFIRSAVTLVRGGLFAIDSAPFDAAILNPPYKKLRTDTDERRLLREVGIETSNLYAGFVGLALRTLRIGGELIAITPRSFCNGPYFTPFRKDLFRLGNLTSMHVFDSRDAAFSGDDVLQENVIFRVERGVPQSAAVTIEWSQAGEVDQVSRRDVLFENVVRTNDADAFIHITPDEWHSRVADIMRSLGGNLAALDLEVSTGRVVDFRVRDFLRATPEEDTIPLVYPTHFSGATIAWPKRDSKKPNALVLADRTRDQVNPAGTYVLVKRFSAKEERRRVVAAMYSPNADAGEWVAFENHLNYFHCNGRGVPLALAQGLTAFLNSTLVDSYFRQFNGHTQVNATDLRKLHYPTKEQLLRIGENVASRAISQTELDEIVEGELLDVAESKNESEGAKAKIAEAIAILKALDLPKDQTNERAGLTLLALVGLKPGEAWSAATNPLCGITPIMEFAADHYGKQWKPNTRETVRRSTIHQFQEAGLVVPNPDQPRRPINSPDYCYQVPEFTLKLLRTFGTSGWPESLAIYRKLGKGLAEKYANVREMARIPLSLGPGKTISLSPGGQNDLIRAIIDEFCPLFTPGAVPLYIGDAGEKWGHFDKPGFEALGVKLDPHGKMPDVVVHFAAKNWLVLVEAVTSHGPVNAKRRGELKSLFTNSSAPLVYVTAFQTKQALNKHLAEIAWETEVWVAEAPTHMIHFNGERFLGPYET